MIFILLNAFSFLYIVLIRAIFGNPFSAIPLIFLLAIEYVYILKYVRGKNLDKKIFFKKILILQFLYFLVFLIPYSFMYFVGKIPLCTDTGCLLFIPIIGFLLFTSLLINVYIGIKFKKRNPSLFEPKLITSGI